MSKTLREVFGHWQAHDVEERNRRTPCGANLNRTLGAGTITEPHSGEAGKAGQTAEQATTRPLESDLHDKIADHCWQKGWLPIHTRMDKPTTFVIPNDTMRVSDFIILRPAPLPWLAVECKRPGQKATPKQLAFLAYCAKLGATTGVVDNWEDALLLLR